MLPLGLAVVRRYAAERAQVERSGRKKSDFDLMIACTAIEHGYGNLNNIGDNELPSSVGPVSVSSDPTLTITDFGMGEFNTCAILSNGTLKCWGAAEVIGLGNLQNVGDDELPTALTDTTPIGEYNNVPSDVLPIDL